MSEETVDLSASRSAPQAWSPGRIALALGASLIAFVLLLAILIVLLMILFSRLIPNDDLGLGTALILVGSGILIPLCWLGWIIISGVVLVRHGGTGIQRRLPQVFAGLTFLGAWPLVDLLVRPIVVWSTEAASSSPHHTAEGAIAVITLLVALVLAVGGYLAGVKVRQKRLALREPGQPITQSILERGGP